MFVLTPFTLTILFQKQSIYTSKISCPPAFIETLTILDGNTNVNYFLQVIVTYDWLLLEYFYIVAQEITNGLQ